MKIQTASQVINLVQELEEKSSRHYEKLAAKCPQKKEVFLSLAKENKKNKLWVQRAYYEVVSDALETGFSFASLSVDESLVKGHLTENRDLRDALNEALDLEEKIEKFYEDAILSSKLFLADVASTFERITEKRKERLQQLRSLKTIVNNGHD